MANAGNFELIPPDPGVLAPDVQLAVALGTEGIGDPLAGGAEPIGRGWAFDFARHQFVRSGLAPAEISDLDQLATWIQKCLLTARFAHPIYSSAYGMDEPFGLIGGTFTGAAVASYTEAVRDALTAHDRIVEVTAFTFSQDDDVLLASFTVHVDEVPPTLLHISSIPITGATP